GGGDDGAGARAVPADARVVDGVDHRGDAAVAVVDAREAAVVDDVVRSAAPRAGGRQQDVGGESAAGDQAGGGEESGLADEILAHDSASPAHLTRSRAGVRAARPRIWLLRVSRGTTSGR